MPGFTTSLLTITPSTTQSGSLEPLMLVMPRICTWPPPPGAPEFIWMFAPGTLPCDHELLELERVALEGDVDGVAVRGDVDRPSLESDAPHAELQRAPGRR